MYIYDLPFEANRELCQILDMDDQWKELAGEHMKYSFYDIVEIEQVSRRMAMSPTEQLLIRWGQANHRVEELFVLLYKMQQCPAIQCLIPHVPERYLKLLRKKKVVRDRDENKIDENDNHPPNLPVAAGSESLVPIPAIRLAEPQQGVLPTTRSIDDNTGRSTSVSSSTQEDSQTDTDPVTNGLSIPLLTMCIRKLSYEELQAATDNWNKANLLGKGGFGEVFKGEWSLSKVAVKKLANNDANNRELIREMLVNQCRHDNILPLYAYSIGGPEACLVYQLMTGGSLEQRLKCKMMPLSWTQRHRIAHGVALGLQFLHTMTNEHKVSTPLIHGDIKPANILLDQCTIPKIADFGLARKGPYGEERSHVKVSRVHGTRPYLPEEYIHDRCLSPAVDVFSFGVVLLEIATALPAMQSARQEPLLRNYVLAQSRMRDDLAILEDGMLYGTQKSNPDLCRKFIAIGIHCTKDNRKERPTMLEVYKTLDAMDFPGKNVG